MMQCGWPDCRARCDLGAARAALAGNTLGSENLPTPQPNHLIYKKNHNENTPGAHVRTQLWFSPMAPPGRRLTTNMGLQPDAHTSDCPRSDARKTQAVNIGL
jgi:hypothetical protein